MRFLPVLVLTLLALAGCNYPVDTAPTPSRPFAPPATAAGAGPDAWLDQVCTALVPVAVTARDVPATVPDDLVGSRNRLVSFIDTRLVALNSAVEQIDAAGPAPIDNGQAASAAAVDVLRQRVAALNERRADLVAVPANDPVTLANSLQRAEASLVLPGAQVLRDIALPANLTAAAGGVPSCRALNSSV